MYVIGSIPNYSAVLLLETHTKICSKELSLNKISKQYFRANEGFQVILIETSHKLG